MQLAPIVLFVYNRPDHTRQTLEALAANDLADLSTLYIYADGPKCGASAENLERVEAVRRVIRGRQWCKEVKIIESVYNKGLADSIVSGVSEVVNRHGRVIVLEDDIVTRKGFLRYMNEALEMYADDERVMQISAYMYPARFQTDQTTFFLRVLACWGWATWKRAWKHYSHDAESLAREWGKSKQLIREFNPWFYEQLRRNATGQMYTWAVRWFASWMSAGGLSLFPYRSLVNNIGHDSSGVHCATNERFRVDPVDSIQLNKVPVVENSQIRSAIDKYFSQPCFIMAISPVRGVKRWKRIAVRLLRLRKFRKLALRALLKLFPELKPVSNPNVNWGVISASLTETTLGVQVKLYSPYRIHRSVIGDYTYIARSSVISYTHIGKFCSIGPNFTCGWGVHPVEGVSTSPMFYSTAKQNGMTLCNYNKIQERKPIHIGNDVFIGMNVTVLDGVTIGDGAVIGAGCVVSKDVPPYAIVVGNPMRILKYRFSEDIIQELLKIAWWDWPAEKLKEVEEHFFDVEKFISDL